MRKPIARPYILTIGTALLKYNIMIYAQTLIIVGLAILATIGCLWIAVGLWIMWEESLLKRDLKRMLGHPDSQQPNSQNSHRVRGGDYSSPVPVAASRLPSHSFQTISKRSIFRQRLSSLHTFQWFDRTWGNLRLIIWIVWIIAHYLLWDLLRGCKRDQSDQRAKSHQNQNDRN